MEDKRTNVEKIRDIAHCNIMDWFEKTCDDYSYYHTECGVRLSRSRIRMLQR